MRVSGSNSLARQSAYTACFACLKWGALILAGAMIATALFLVWNAKHDQLSPSSAPVSEKPRAQVQGPFIVEREAGRTLWRLKAQKAEQQGSGHLHLLRPELELFTKGGKRIPITGIEAWFAPLSKEIRFRGDVRMAYGEWRLFCDTMRYVHQKDMIRIPGPFRIRGKRTRMRGRNLTVWRETRHLRVDGGVWIETSHLPEMESRP